MSEDKFTVTIDPDLKELIPEFLELSKKDVNSMREALGKADWTTLERYGHSLKGCGSGYGFHLISEIGAKIESLSPMKETEKVHALIEELGTFLDRVEVKYY